MWGFLGAVAGSAVDAVFRVPEPSAHVQAQLDADKAWAQKPGVALEADGLSDKPASFRHDEIWEACQALFELHGASPRPSPSVAPMKPGRSSRGALPPSRRSSNDTGTDAA